MDQTLTTVPLGSHRRLRFIAGIALMTSSFLVYPTYPVILLWLPFSVNVKILISVVVWSLSWTTFSVGAFLAGPEGYAWFKSLGARLKIVRRQQNPKTENGSKLSD